MQILLEFQLNSHEELLRPLLPIFSEHEFNGIFTHESFLEMMSRLNIESEGNKFIKTLDPHHTNSITISSVISLFSNVFFT